MPMVVLPVSHKVELHPTRLFIDVFRDIKDATTTSAHGGFQNGKYHFNFSLTFTYQIPIDEAKKIWFTTMVCKYQLRYMVGEQQRAKHYNKKNYIFCHTILGQKESF